MLPTLGKVMVATLALPAAYEVLTSGCGLVDRSPLGKLLLTGPDAATFLNGQVSNDVEALAPGEGCLATFLTPKGKMLGDLRILRTHDEPLGLLLLTERSSLQALFDQIRRGVIGWQVELHKRTLELGLLSLIGPRADEVAGAAGLAIPPAAEHATLDGVARTDVGLDVLVPADESAQTRRRLLEAGAVETAEDAAEVVRVEHGRPRYGLDLDDTTMPAEAGLEEQAVSFSKGCYVGQETVARLHWKGRPNRHLRGLRLEGPAAPGDVVSDGEREVGRLGSVVDSPRLGPIALALVRREVEPGARVAVGDHRVAAEVVALPFTQA
jgi:folate-binding protein YgfZ